MAGCSSSRLLSRPMEAEPRWNRFTTQPSAIIGQINCIRYTPKATNSPVVMLPEITIRPPTKRTARGAQSPISPMIGWNAP